MFITRERMNLFLDKIATYGDRICLKRAGRLLKYAEFLEEISRYALWIQSKIEVQAPCCIALRATPTPEYFIQLFGITEAGHTAVPYIHSDELKCIEINGIIDGDTFEIQSTDGNSNAVSGGLILQTSGITGAPKIVLHHFPTIASKYLKLHTSHKSIFIFSPEHISGIETTMSILASGGCMYFPENRAPETILKAIDQEQIELMACTPTFLSLILWSGNQTDLSSIKYINFGAERMSHGLLQIIRKRWAHIEFRQAFGTTETTNIRTFSDADSFHFRPGKAGKDYKIEQGKLFLRKPESLVKIISGSQITEDGWYETGDIVEENEAGYIEIIGRQNEMIIVGGEKLAPAELENTISKVDGVMQVRVYGKPHPITGQMICAEVQALPESDPEWVKQEIRKVCKSSLPEYKQPHKIIIQNSPEYNRRLKRI